jgi:hypothetical protein
VRERSVAWFLTGVSRLPANDLAADCAVSNEQEQQWVATWRHAGPQLERIRNEELRSLDESAGLRLLGAGQRSSGQTSGLIAWQAWMMRLRVLELMKRLEHL